MRARNQNPELVEIMKNTHIKKPPQKTWHRFTIEYDYVEQTIFIWVGWIFRHTYEKVIEVMTCNDLLLADFQV